MISDIVSVREEVAVEAGSGEAGPEEAAVEAGSGEAGPGEAGPEEAGPPSNGPEKDPRRLSTSQSFPFAPNASYNSMNLAADVTSL